MGNLLGPAWSTVTHVVSLDETTMAALTFGKPFLSLEIYKPAMKSERLDNLHFFSDTDNHLWKGF